MLYPDVQVVATSGRILRVSEVTFFFFFHHHEIFICAQCTGHVLQSQCTGCYPAQCSKIDMATSNFLLGQKYGIQVVRNDMDPVLLWPLILFVNSASDGWSCHLFTRWTGIQVFSFMHDLLPGLGTIQRPMPLQVNMQRDFLGTFILINQIYEKYTDISRICSTYPESGRQGKN